MRRFDNLGLYSHKHRKSTGKLLSKSLFQNYLRRHQLTGSLPALTTIQSSKFSASIRGMGSDRFWTMAKGRRAGIQQSVLAPK